MADIKRSGRAIWSGDLRGGDGTMTTESGVLKEAEFTFATRFKDAPGTNPDELIAAAHAGCYSMALAGFLSEKGYEVEAIDVTATIHVTPQDGKGFAITRSELEVEGDVPGLDEETFEQLAHDADETCPVSNLLRPGLEIEIETRLRAS